MYTVLRLTSIASVAMLCALSTAVCAEGGARPEPPVFNTEKPFRNRLGDGSEKIVPPKNAPLWPGFTREKKGDKLSDTRTIKKVNGFECMDFPLALKVQNLLKEGKEKEALELRAHKAQKPGCAPYMGPLNYEKYDIGTLEGGGVIAAICDPLREPHDCVFFPLELTLPPLELIGTVVSTEK